MAPGSPRASTVMGLKGIRQDLWKNETCSYGHSEVEGGFGMSHGICWQVHTGRTVGTSQRRVRDEPVPSSPRHSAISGIPTVGRAARYAQKGSMSRWDTQGCPFLFFLTMYLVCGAPRVSTFHMDTAGPCQTASLTGREDGTIKELFLPI